MKVTILMENTQGHPSCQYEHGLSLYVETKKHKLLIDSGASDKVWDNAQTLGIDLSAIDLVFLSHGHYDHSGGLVTFRNYNQTAPIYLQKSALDPYYHGERYIGIASEIANLHGLKLLEGNLILDDEISIFSGIQGRRLWPQSNLVLSKKVGDQLRQDEFEHEQCIVIREDGKDLLLSGCAHNGILNILDRYEQIYHRVPDAVISGFHMMKKTEYSSEEIDNIEETARELKELPSIFYSGHCTGLEAMEIMKKIMGDQLRAIHSGDELGNPFV